MALSQTERQSLEDMVMRNNAERVVRELVEILRYKGDRETDEGFAEDFYSFADDLEKTIVIT